MKTKVELTFPKDLKDEPIFYEMVKRFEVIPTIFEASFSTDTGWAYVALEGEEDEIKKLFDFLKSKHIIIDHRS